MPLSLLLEVCKMSFHYIPNLLTLVGDLHYLPACPISWFHYTAQIYHGKPLIPQFLSIKVQWNSFYPWFQELLQTLWMVIHQSPSFCQSDWFIYGAMTQLELSLHIFWRKKENFLTFWTSLRVKPERRKQNKSMESEEETWKRKRRGAERRKKIYNIWWVPESSYFHRLSLIKEYPPFSLEVM